MSAKKARNSEDGAVEITVLESSSVLPSTFQIWKNDTLLLFKIKNLDKFLTSPAASIFSEAEPLFGWELRSEVKVSSRGECKTSKDLARDFLDAA
ncbi:hypothetical protein B484DRAFT_402704, partial [Ochromonadaceae sp. CCMP2298]